MTHLLVLAILATAMTSNANAVDYISWPQRLEANQDDPLLTQELIDEAITEGIREAGFTVTRGGKMPLVSFTYHAQFVPKLENFRLITGRLEVSDYVGYKGGRTEAVLCDVPSISWRAGPNVKSHVSKILGEMKELGRDFAKECAGFLTKQR